MKLASSRVSAISQFATRVYLPELVCGWAVPSLPFIGTQQYHAIGGFLFLINWCFVKLEPVIEDNQKKYETCNFSSQDPPSERMSRGQQD